MRRFGLVTLTTATIAGALLVSVARPSAQGQSQDQGQTAGPPEWANDIRHDVSRPLRDMPSKPVVATRPDFEVLRPPLNERGGQDTAVQTRTVAPFPAIIGATYPGIGASGYAPPDTVGEAGPNDYVQWVNVRFAVFDRNNGMVMRPGFPKAGNTPWSGFGGNCETRNDGDPIVQYDQTADRWILTQFSVASGNYLQCVAVSVTGDPTGAYYRYAFPYTDFPDYPKLAVWPNAYFITFNMFRNGRTFTGGRACAYNKAAMMAGQAATQVCFQVSNASLLPSDLDGTTLPPAGSPNFIMSRGSNALNLWKFTPNFSTPKSSTFTGPTSIAVAGFTIACGTGGACIPQAGTSNKLDSLGDRLMYRLAYRNFGASQSLVVNHSVNTGSVTGVRWYEIRNPGGTPTVYQQGTFAPADGRYRWMGSIAMDKLGNIAMGYSASSAATNPAIEWTGRLASDPLGAMRSPATLWAGGGSQTGSLTRWGDYSTISVDPRDDCTFWYTSQYIPSNGSFNWQTFIGSFTLQGCTVAPASSPAPRPAAAPR